MAQNDADATAKISAAMIAQLLNKLTEKGILDESDIEQMMAEATKVLKDPSGANVFEGVGARYEGEIGDQQQQTIRPGR